MKLPHKFIWDYLLIYHSLSFEKNHRIWFHFPFVVRDKGSFAVSLLRTGLRLHNITAIAQNGGYQIETKADQIVSALHTARCSALPIQMKAIVLSDHGVPWPVPLASVHIHVGEQMKSPVCDWA